MSIATELQNLNDNILDAYTAIEDKGGMMPGYKNTDELSYSVDSIPTSIIHTIPSNSGSNINVYHTGFCPFSQENASRDFFFTFVLNSISVDPAYGIATPTLLCGTNEGGSPYNGIYIRFDVSFIGDRQRGYKNGSTDMFAVGLFAFGASGVTFQRIALTGSSFPMRITFMRLNGELSCDIDDVTIATSTPGAATTPVYFDNEIILGAAYTSAMTDGTYQRPFRSFSFSELSFGYFN